MKTGLERMGCALAALWVPDKNIALSLTRSGQPMSPESLQRAQHHLMAWMQLQQRTIVVNHISKVASDVAAPYKILACPVRHPSERVMGVLALFNPPSAPGFRFASNAHRRGAGEESDQHHSGAIRFQHRPHDPPGVRTPGLGAARHRRRPRETHIILYLDIDRLHVINETFGMHVGDDVIVSVAECMAKALPAGALSARISGDRLAALIPELRAWTRPRSSPKKFARPPPPSCRAPGRAPSRCRCASASRRSAAPTTRWRMHWRPRRSPAKRPRIAAAIASKCSRIPIRASSGAIPTSW